VNRSDKNKPKAPAQWPDHVFVKPTGPKQEEDLSPILKPGQKALPIPVVDSQDVQEVIILDIEPEPLFEKIFIKNKLKPSPPAKQAPVYAEKPLDKGQSSLEVEVLTASQIKGEDFGELEKEWHERDQKRQKRRRKEATKRAYREYRRSQKKLKKKARKRKQKNSKITLEKILNRPIGELLRKIPLVNKLFLQIEENKKRSSQKQKKPGLFENIKTRRRNIRIAKMQRLQKNIVGLEINESHVRAVRVKDNKMMIYEAEIPPGIIVDGIVEEEEELSEELKKFWQNNKIDSSQINFSINNKLINLGIVSIPAKAEEDALQALALSAAEVISPMDIKKSIIDYHQLGRRENSFYFQVVAADQNMVKGFIRSIEKAGLYAVSCEVGPLAAARSFVLPRNTSLNHMLIQIGPETTSIAVTQGQDVLFLRNISIGINDFSLAIKERLGLTLFQANFVRDQIGIGGPFNSELDPEVIKESREAMRSVADNLFQEISQTKTFYENGSRNQPIGTWSVVGEGALIQDLPRQIGLFSDLPGDNQIKPWPGFETIKNIETKSTAIGLSKDHDLSLIPRVDFKTFLRPGLRKQSKINLNQSEKAAKELARSHGLVSPKYSPKVIGIAIALLIFGGSFYLKNNLGQGNEQLKTEIASLKEAEANNLESGLLPVYQGASGAEATALSNQILSQPNPDLTIKMINFLDSSKLINDYFLTTETRNYRLEVEFLNEQSIEPFLKGLTEIKNIGQVVELESSLSSQATPKKVYSVGGYSGVSG
jgi:type IV pilus assembly protein PilM